MKKYLLLWLLLIIVRTSFAQCPPMNQPQNIQVCNGTITSPVNFTSNAANVVYTWANSNPAIGLAASGRGNIPAFTAVNTGLSGVTATITVTPKLETSQTYSYTGAMQTFVVPAGVTSIRVDVKGAQGGSAIYNQGSAKPDDLGGKGGRVTAEYPVTPGQTIYVFVGGNNGYNGGGNGGGSIEQPKGGDASDIRIGGTALSNRVIVAGGGGGGGNNCSINAEPGGAGGGLIGETGFQCGDQSGISVGQGGTQSAGGIAGTSSLSNGNSIPATAGQLGLGGNAGIFYGTAAGGGGGGYFGGGGATYGGGGGGSSYTDPQATSVVHTQGFHSGLGQVIITYDTPCASPATKTFTYTVNPTPTMVQPADQSVFAGTNTIAVNFSSPSTGGYISYDWTNNTPAIGLAASGTGNIPAFVTVNASNAPVTATIMVTPKLISGLLDINQTVAPYCAASFAQPNLVQSFKPVANTITGAGVSFQSGGNGSVTISLWDKLPNAGGVQLASGTTTSSPNPWVDVYWAPVSVTPGNTYYLVFSGTNMSQCLAGSSLNPYPDGQVYANNDYQSYPNVDFAFRTYSPGLTTCAGSSQQFQVTVKVLKPDANGILYVKKGSNGLGDSWANAVAELADALVMAKNLNAATPGKVKQIWVAGGIYKPMYNPADNAFGTSAGRNNAFLLVKDVKVYGGFAGSETALAQRDLSAADNKAILSGDFTGNDAVAGFGSTLNITGNAENAYQVVIAAGDAGTAVLDGFTISGGYANGGNLPQINQQQFLVSNWGAGMYVANSSGLAISHIEFVGNKATTGAAMAISGNVDAPKIEEVTFTRNHATQSGGALYSTQNSTIVKSVFIGNKSDDLAGAIAKLGGSVFFVDRCFFAGNSSTGNGGAIYDMTGAGNNYINSVFSGNKSGNKGGALYVHNISATRTNSFINCMFSGNTAAQGSATIDWNSTSVTFQQQLAFVNSIINDGENSIGAGGEVKAYLKNTLLKQSGTPQSTTILQGNSVSLLNQDPLFTDADGADNILGTADDDLTLKSNSPAAGAGDNSLYTGNINTDKDLGGRQRLIGTQIDLGAYESLVQAQTIAASNLTKTYGDIAFEPGATASSGLIVSYVSADNSIAEAFQDATDGNKWKLNIKKAGMVNITASQTGNGAFSPAQDAIFSLIINQKPVTVSIKSNAVFTKVYDAGTSGTVLATDLELGNNDVINNDDVQLSLSSATAQYDTKDAGTSKTMTLPIASVVLSGAQAGNYKIGNANALSTTTAAITSKPLTITANNFSKVYDGTGYSGGNGVSYSAFALGEDQTVLSGTLVYGGTSQGAVNTGSYDIVPGGLSSPNYTISYVNGQLSISLNNVNVLTFNAQTAGSTLVKTYGDADINASAIASSGLVATYQSNNPSVATVNASGQVSILKTGTATITASQAGDTNFGSAAPIAFQVEVTKKLLTVTANDFSKTYDGIAYGGGNGVSYNGFVNSETPSVLSGILVYGGTSQGAFNTGNYPIIPQGLSSANYDFEYKNGTLSIVQSGANVITFNHQVDGATQQLTYGSAVIDASAIASSGLSVSYSSSNPAAASVNTSGQVQILAAGTATITATQAGDVNHTAATPVSFTINIRQKALIITANNASKQYNGQSYNTGNGVTYNGFVNGENEQALQGTLNYSGTAIGAKDVGSYFISPGGYLSANYAITYQDGSLTITKANLTVTADAKTKVYGTNDPALTYKVTGLVNNDASTVVTGTLKRAVGENIGSYAISNNDLTASNYLITYAGADLTITKANLTVTADAKTKVYGTNDPALTYKVTGLVNNDASTVVTGTLKRAVGENVGTYAISNNDLTASNYTITYAGADLTISKANLTVTADAKTKVYGTNDPALTYKVTGLVNNDASTVVTGTLKRAVGENVGTYAISNNDLTASNYTITYAGANLTISKATISGITLSDGSFTYDAAAKSILIAGTLPAGTTVSYTGNNQTTAGTYAITATIDGGVNYTNLTLQATLRINKAKQVITFKEIPAVYRDAGTLSLDISSNSPLPIKIYSDNTLVAEVTGKQEVTVRGVGLALIRAEQSGDGNYIAADAVTRELRVRNEDGAKLPVRVHPAVSPNGDGINDYLRIEGIDEYPENKIGIFDANGNLVQELKGYDNHSNRFDGYKESRAVPAGTYFYMLEVKINGKWVYDKGFFVVRY